MKLPTHDLTVFASTLQGDESVLRGILAPDSIVCVAPQPRGVFVVEDMADGSQAAMVAHVGPSGSGSISPVRVPRSFPIRHVSHDDERFVVTSADGRTVHGRLWQFKKWVKVLDQEHNPSYEQHIEEAFLATHLIPDDPLQPAHLTTDPVLGDVRLDPVLPQYADSYEAIIPIADDELRLAFDSAGQGKATALLPHARVLVTALDRIAAAGAEFLWNWGADRDEPDEEKEAFLREVSPPTDLVIYRSGDFEIHYAGASGTKYFMDGYWPAVQFTADLTPVAVTVEA